jgi:predicted ArsR family transcriptional regulator
MNVGMNVAADSIGRTLARLGKLTARAPHSEFDTSREHIARIVCESDHPLTVEDIAQVTGLHPNTIRTHLEVLRAAGRVDRTRQDAQGRGRPKWLYSPAASAIDPYRQFAQDLTGTLSAAHDEALADEAAKRWRLSDGVITQPVATPDEAVEVAAQALSRLGFDVDVSPVGDAVYLGQCPYAALIAENPVICDIHAKALEQILAGTGQDVELVSMDVFPRPGVCVAHLRRPDVAPYRTVTGSAGIEQAPDGKGTESAKMSKAGKTKRKKQSRRTA